MRHSHCGAAVAAALGLTSAFGCLGTESGNPRPPFDEDPSVDLADPGTPDDFGVLIDESPANTDVVTEPDVVDEVQPDETTTGAGGAGFDEPTASGGDTGVGDTAVPEVAGGAGPVGAEPQGNGGGGAMTGGAPAAVAGAGDAMTATTSPISDMTTGVTSNEASCLADTCSQQAEAAAEALRQAVPAPALLTGSQCTELVDPVDVAPTSSGCDCQLADATSFTLNGLDGCRLAGRVGCLMSEQEFPGCDEAPNEAACNAACEQAIEAKNADADAHLVSVVSAMCEGAECGYVLDVDGACYRNGSTAPEPCP